MFSFHLGNFIRNCQIFCITSSHVINCLFRFFAYLKKLYCLKNKKKPYTHKFNEINFFTDTAFDLKKIFIQF